MDAGTRIAVKEIHMDKMQRFPRAFETWRRAYLSLMGIVLGLVLVAVSGARADLTADFFTTRGTVTANGMSLGAFTATSTEFNFTGLQWMGDADTLAIFDELAEPGVLSSPVTLTDPPVAITLPVGGAFYVQNGLSDGSSGPTQVAPLFFTPTAQMSSVTFTPSGSNTKFTGGSEGTVAGGGTYAMTFSGILDGSENTTPNVAVMTTTLRLNNVDPSIYGGTNLLIAEKSSGVWSVPEPKSSAAVVIGLGVMLLKFGRRRRGLPV